MANDFELGKRMDALGTLGACLVPLAFLVPLALTAACVGGGAASMGEAANDGAPVPGGAMTTAGQLDGQPPDPNLAGSGGGPDMGTPGGQPNGAAADHALASYWKSLPSWSDYAPLRDPDDAPVPDAEPMQASFTDGDTDYACTLTEYSLTETPAEMAVFNPDAEVLWLGGLLQGRGYRDGLGALAELPVRQRAPLTVFIDLLSEQSTRTVERPDAAAVNRAIGDLVEEATNSGHRAASNVHYRQTSASSLEQAALSLGISARHLGVSVDADASLETSVRTNRVTAYFVQRMYTASVVLPQTPMAFFDDSLDEAALLEQEEMGNLGPDNPPTYVSSIVYGRMMMVTMTSTHSAVDMSAALNASYEKGFSGIDVEAEAFHRKVLAESEFQVSTVGGPREGVQQLIRDGEIAAYFDSDFALTEARPLSYTVRHLGTNEIAKVSETTRYRVKECNGSAATPTGARYHVLLDRLRVLGSGCDQFPDGVTPDLYYDFRVEIAGETPRELASLAVGKAKSIDYGTDLRVNKAQDIDVYADGRGAFRVKGTVWDKDGTSGDDTIGSWDLGYGFGTSDGERYFTRNNGDCKVRLFLNITKVEDLYD